MLFDSVGRLTVGTTTAIVSDRSGMSEKTSGEAWKLCGKLFGTEPQVMVQVERMEQVFWSGHA